MGRNISTGLDAVEQPVSLFAADTVAANDLVKVDGGGWVRKVAETFTVAEQNTPAGVTPARAAFNVGANLGSSNTAYGVFNRNVFPVPDGGFLMAYSGNGTTSSTGLNLAFYGPSAAVRFVLVLSSGASVSVARLTRAGMDNVLVTWQESTNLMLAVVNFSTGAIVQAAAIIGAVSGVNDWNLATLANGEVVVAYPASTNMVFKRFNATGALQGVETVVDVAQAPSWISVLALAAGGFIVRWAKTNATSAQRMARFNAAGALHGSIVTIISGASLYDGATNSYMVGSLDGKLIEVSNGNIVTTECTTATAQSIKVYDSALNLLTTIALGAAGANLQDWIQLAPRHGGGFWAMGYAGNKMREYTNGGVAVRESVSSPGSMPGASRIIDRPGNGPVLVYMALNTSTPSSGITVNCFKSDLSIETNTGYAPFNTSYALAHAWVEMLANDLIASNHVTYSTNSYSMGLAFVGMASAIGVAQNAAALGQTVRVATAGKFAMNQTFTSPAFDRRAFLPPGTKGMTLGTTAILNGING